MSGLIGGLFGSHGSAKTDRTSQLQSFSDLQNVFNQSLPVAQNEQKRGDLNLDSALSSLGLSGDYFKKILSGNRTETLAAVQPTTQAATNQSDAAKRNIAASGTARGGGVAGENQQIEDKTRAITDNAIAGAKPGAAAGLSDVASRVAGIGESQLATALGALGIGSGATGTLGSLAGGAREADLKRQSDMGGAIANIALSFLGL